MQPQRMANTGKHGVVLDAVPHERQGALVGGGEQPEHHDREGLAEHGVAEPFERLVVAVAEVDVAGEGEGAVLQGGGGEGVRVGVGVYWEGWDGGGEVRDVEAVGGVGVAMGEDERGGGCRWELWSSRMEDVAEERWMRSGSQTCTQSRRTYPGYRSMHPADQRLAAGYNCFGLQEAFGKRVKRESESMENEQIPFGVCPLISVKNPPSVYPLSAFLFRMLVS